MIEIIEDKGQQAGKHEIKRKWFQDNNIKFIQLPLPVGDYILMNEKVLDVIERKSKRVMINKDKDTNEYITKIGTELKKMDLLGTYMTAVDTKKDLQEVLGNVCSRTHGRFRDEVILAHNNNVKLYVLVEHGGNVKSLNDVAEWKNPRQFKYEMKIRKEYGMPKGSDFQTELAELKSHGVKIKRGPNTGEELFKAMVTMQEKYGCEFLFCDKKDTGRRIIEILGGE